MGSRTRVDDRGVSQVARRRSKGSAASNGLLVVLGLAALLMTWVLQHPIVLVAAAVLIGLGLYGHYRVVQKQRAALLRSGITQIDHMTGLQFEQRLLVHFQSLGWRVRTTKTTGDFGADLVGRRPDGTRVVIQAKRWQGSVGVGAVQEVHAARGYYRAPDALLITNSHLSVAARELAARTGVEVWDRARLVAELGRPEQASPPAPQRSGPGGADAGRP